MVAVLLGPSFKRSANTRQTMPVLSVQQTMPGELDKRDLLEQKLQKVWAMKNISLMLIIYGVLGFPDGVFRERCKLAEASVDGLL